MNHEAWVIPTPTCSRSSLGLFLVLYGRSSLDLRKFQAMAAGLNRALAPGDNLVQPLDGTAIGDAPLILDDPRTGAGQGDGAGVEDVQVGPAREQQAEAALAREEQVAVARAEEAEAFTDVRQTMSQRADQLGLGDSLAFRDDPRGLVVSILSDRVLFAPGSAAVQPEGAEILGLVAEAVRGVPSQLSVEGRNDNRPISTAAFPSNWELSTARATTVLQALVATGQIAPERISAAGYADQRRSATTRPARVATATAASSW